MNNHMKTCLSFFKTFLVALLIASLMYAAVPVRVARAATIIVNDNGDGFDEDLGDGICEVTDTLGDCTLRAAIQQANYVNDTDLIQFDASMTITLGSTLPTIVESVTIDGTGYDIVINAGAAANGFNISVNNVTIQGLELYGPSGHGIYIVSVSTVLINNMVLYNGTGGVNTDGISMSGVTSVTVQNSFIYNFPDHGIDVTGTSSGVVIDNNYIGIEADGVTAGANGDRGVRILNSSGNTISDNLISGNTSGGILVSGVTSDGNSITGNYIGTNAAGTAAVGNSGHGIRITNAPNTQVGGSTAANRNIISGNIGTSSGVYVSGTDSAGTNIQGNYIGTDWEGESTIPNTQSGIRLGGTVNVTVGGNSSAYGNVISGNDSSGVVIFNSADNNTVKNNIIGLDVDGDTDLGNSGTGVTINNSTYTTVSDNTISMNTSDGVRLTNNAKWNTILSNRIGLSQTGEVVLGNGANGVYIYDSLENKVSSNIIAFNNNDGVSVSGSPSVANPIMNNSIYSNGNLGIDLVVPAAPEVTANDGPGDADTGPNELQNFPVFTAQIEGTGVRITGTFESGPHPARINYDIQFFVNDYCDGKGNGEGKTYIGMIDNLQVDTLHQATIDQLFSPVSVSEGQFITATATYDEGGGGWKDTSEFSPCAVVQPESSPGSSGVFVVNRLTNGADANPGDEVCEATAGIGNCTLRAAIQEVNAGTAPPYTIAFSIPSPYIIAPPSALPAITTPVIIDGTSQPGYAGVPIVMIDGTGVGAGHGLEVNIDEVEVHGLSIVNFSAGAGVYVTHTNVTIQDNYIGVETDGSTLGANQTGIYLFGAGTNVILDNMISGNDDGIRLVGSSSSLNVIQGNMIGTDMAGTSALMGNTDDGISVEGGHDNLIGGTGGGQGNTISGNSGDGIEITGGGTGNLVYGNNIGVQGGGSGDLANGGYGVNINGGSDSRITYDNVIAYNGDSGVYVVNPTSTGNLIAGSSIYSNATLDIELASGGNNSQAAPTLTAALQGPSYTYVEGTLSAAPSTMYIIDLYSSPPIVPGPPVKTYQIWLFVSTDGAGNVNFSGSFPVSLAIDDQVFATAIDMDANTSQFSASELVAAGAPVFTSTYTPTSVNTSTPTRTPTSSGSGATNTSSFATNTHTTIPYTNTPSGPIKTMTAAASTLTAMAWTPTTGWGGTVTSTQWWPTATDTQIVSATDGTATDGTATVTDIGGGDGEGDGTETPTVTPEFGLSPADQTATAAQEAGEGGGRSNLSILLWVFIGLAVLFLLAGGAMELIRWLNSRRV